MADYFFPALFLVPDFAEQEVAPGKFRLSKRLWQTSIFDLATLATKHKLHLPYQLMDVLLGSCNSEIAISGAESQAEAVRLFDCFRLGLYVAGVSPFLAPFLTTHSINAYSGINEREANLPRKVGPTSEGFTSKTATMEAWPNELSMQCLALRERMKVDLGQVEAASRFAFQWRGLLARTPSLHVVGDVAKAAPRLESLEQSILHIWTGIESLFPTVSTEVSFRVALYLAQLCADPSDRKAFHAKVKAAYGTRSKIAHGSARDITFAQWEAAWSLLLSAVSAVVRRAALPSEQELMDELLEGTRT